MPNRFIRESIWTSPNLNALSDLAERHFYRLLPLPDDHGCFEATPLVVKGRVYPLKPKITERDIQRWHDELQQNGILRLWSEGDRIFGLFPTWPKHQRIRSLHQRKTPEPPTSAVNCRQVSADDGLIPIPIPIPKNLSASDDAVEVSFLTKKKRRLTGRSLQAFELFWQTFNHKKGKAEAGDAWLDVPALGNGNGKLNEELLAKILDGARREAKARPDLVYAGKGFKWAQGWLSCRRWEDDTADPERGGWE